MSKKSVFKNYIYNLIYQILVIILPLVTTPYVSRILGAEGIGIYSYTISIVTYFIIFGTLGISMYAQREIAYVQNDKYKRSKVFYEIIIIRAITLTLSLVVFSFVFINKGEYAIYYRILLLEFISNIFDVSYFFQGLEEFKKIIKRNLLIKALSILSTFIFIKHKSDINIYLLIYVLATLIGNISLWPYLHKFLEKVRIKDLQFNRHIKPIIILFIPQIATNIYMLLDKTMIGTLVKSKSEVGFYEQTQKILKTILILATSLGTVMLPRIANDFATGKKEAIKNKIMNSFNFVCFLSIPMMFGMMIVSKDLFPWFLGEGFQKSVNISYVMCPIIFFIGLSNVSGMQYLLPTKRQREFTISVFIGAIVNVILNFILIPKLKSIGAAIATVIAEFLVSLCQLYFIREEYPLKNIFLMSIKYFISSILMCFFVKGLNIFMFNHLMVTTRMFLDVFFGIIIYIALLNISKDQFLLKYEKQFLNKFKHIKQ